MTRTAQHILASAVALVIAGAGTVFLIHEVNAAPAPAAEEAGSEAADPYHLKDQTITFSAEAAKIAGVDEYTLVASTVPSTLTLSGRTDLDQERVTHVHAQYPGRVVGVGDRLDGPEHPADNDKAKLPLRLGDRVLGPNTPSGPTILCTIESIDLAQAKAGYLQAQVQNKLDQDALVRTRELLKKQILAEKYLLDAQSAVTKDAAVLDAARHQLLVFGLTDKDIANIGNQVGKERMTYSLTSPRTGMIVEKGVVGGELADPTLNLFTIADPSTLWVWGDVYERDRQRVKEGQKVKVIFTSDPEHPRDCTVEWVSPVIDATTRSIKIRGSLDNTDGRLLAQMYTTLLVTVDEGKDAIVVPAVAVVHKGPEAFVFVREASGKDGTTYRRARVRVEPIDVGPGLEPVPAVASSVAAGRPADATGPVQLLRITEGVLAGQKIVLNGALGLFNEMEQRQNDQQQLQSQPTPAPQ